MFSKKEIVRHLPILDRCQDKDSQGILNEKRKQDRQVRHEEAPIRFRLEVYGSLNLRAVGG